MSSVKRTAHEVGALVSNVIDATNGLQPWELPQSVLGRVRRAAPPRYSEYAMFVERDVGRTARYLTNVLVPSLQRVGPSWVPSALRRVFFHETTIQRRPDHLGSYDSFPAEHWFFINGILTDSGMAGWNADYLARIFHRSFTIVQNATDGPLADLLECADEKAFGMNGEPADVAFPEIHRALKDPTKDRVIIIAHSQGTLIAAVLVRLLRLVYARTDEVISEAKQAEELDALRRTGVTLDPDDFEDVTSDELQRLEIYCFANCASEMRYVDPDRAPSLDRKPRQRARPHRPARDAGARPRSRKHRHRRATMGSPRRLGPPAQPSLPARDRTRARRRLGRRPEDDHPRTLRAVRRR